ncbi:MAG: bifunctional (p)ppGpp synthetase/guanosine-3',5'-bis(diphosphate) 3'-pyrophosphohydrolase [bacterium]
MIRLNEILDRVAEYDPKADLDLIEKAYVFSAKVHQGQVRLSGEPYLIHPLAVAGLLAELRLDAGTVATGLLHDVVEDTRTTLEEIRDLFGVEIAELVDAVTKLSRMSFSSREEQQAENFRKMILAMSRDIRVILIKLADRLHNIRTLQFHSRENQIRIARETLEIYAPIAHRLGITWMKRELEDQAFRFLEPEAYQEIAEKVAQAKVERDEYIREVEGLLKSELESHGLKPLVQGRFKHYYSIYKKMQSQQLPFEELYDLLAFRVILRNKAECYEALGYVHAMWPPIPGKFNDYIGRPKPNGYQSLHTTVFGPHKKRMEVQIRTELMHRIAEEGIAAHWRYKEGRIVQDKDDERLAWVRQILDWQQELEDPREFLDMVKVELFPDEVYVLTPKGAVKQLPRGSTPVDFAYSIHTEVGHQCVGARVNDKIVPLRYELQSGDVVEIVTHPDHKPSRDWLKFVKTSRARAKIRQWFKTEERNRSMALGRDLCEKEFRRHGLSFSKLIKGPEMEELLKRMSFEDVDDLMAAVGYGRVSPRSLATHFLPEEPQEVEEEKEQIPSLKTRKGKPRAVRGGVRVHGVEDVMVHFARCCQPLPGDRVLGFITRGRGVTVHAADCSNIQDAEAERLIPVEWNQGHQGSHPVRVRVVCSDRKGILAAIAQTLSQADINITHAKVQTSPDKKAVGFFDVEVTDLKHLEGALRAIRRIEEVIEADRVRA